MFGNCFVTQSKEKQRKSNFSLKLSDHYYFIQSKVV